MDKALLERKNLDALLVAIRKVAKLFAPARDGRDGETAFSPVESTAEIHLEPVNTRLSAKGLFFPQRETLMRFSGSALSDVTLPTGAFVVFGVRPCDARSLTWLDCVFIGGGQEDPYFQERRKSAVVIAMACDQPCASCFCTSVGGSPYGSEGADLLASATGKEGALLFEAHSDKGGEFLRTYADFFAAVDGDTLKERDERAAAAKRRMKALDCADLKEKLDAGIDSPLWDTLTNTCLGCGVCAYLCPVCHCFDITDEKRGAEGVRVRSWDSCQFPRFTLHASGHNPRPLKKARMRQRIMHKFSYAVETAGTVFCSGCGRCVRACPVNLDIRRILAAFKDLQ
jgi:hypothetical protein